MISKEELGGAREEIEILRKQNQHLTGIQTIQTNELFGRSTEKTEDILDQVLNEDIPKGDPLSEESTPEESQSDTETSHDNDGEEKHGSRDGDEDKGDDGDGRRRLNGLIPPFDNTDPSTTPEKKKRMIFPNCQFSHSMITTSTSMIVLMVRATGVSRSGKKQNRSR